MSDHGSLLISAIRRGEESAWEELIIRYERRLFAFAYSRLNNAAAAEDVVQETFLGFLRSLPNYNDTTPLETYLFSIAAHKLTDVLRKEGRRPRLIDGAEADSGRFVSRQRAVSSLMRSVERRQHESKIIAETLEHLIVQWIARREFERLKCIELLWSRGWPNKKVAAQIGITEQQVANHKHAVVLQLKDAVRRNMQDPVLPSELI
ncbi:MAG: sigma-70 family RNA polymerase sigma factor [Planctomycetota bacterium]|nr:sigma-70 family RNA polymerase sigma factor [Planctomycetota bacterium]MDA1214732.1 sigma-70 family RNA polymerase sigma factor [Planctomycetota bacterium]